MHFLISEEPRIDELNTVDDGLTLPLTRSHQCISRYFTMLKCPSIHYLCVEMLAFLLNDFVGWILNQCHIFAKHRKPCCINMAPYNQNHFLVQQTVFKPESNYVKLCSNKHLTKFYQVEIQSLSAVETSVNRTCSACNFKTVTEGLQLSSLS